MVSGEAACLASVVCKMRAGKPPGRRRSRTGLRRRRVMLGLVALGFVAWSPNRPTSSTPAATSGAGSKPSPRLLRGAAEGGSATSGRRPARPLSASAWQEKVAADLEASVMSAVAVADANAGSSSESSSSLGSGSCTIGNVLATARTPPPSNSFRRY